MGNFKKGQLVTPDNIEMGKWILDSEDNLGLIISIIDLHNVEVNFAGGGKGLYCFSRECGEYIKNGQDPIYYIE